MPIKTLIAILISVSLTAAAAAQERRLPTQSELRLSYAPVVQIITSSKAPTRLKCHSPTSASLRQRLC
jgi:hypothetical protein